MDSTMHHDRRCMSSRICEDRTWPLSKLSLKWTSFVWLESESPLDVLNDAYGDTYHRLDVVMNTVNRKQLRLIIGVWHSIRRNRFAYWKLKYGLLGSHITRNLNNLLRKFPYFNFSNGPLESFISKLEMRRLENLITTSFLPSLE